MERDPSSGTDFVRATFSHKGRREVAASTGGVIVHNCKFV